MRARRLVARLSIITGVFCGLWIIFGRPHQPDFNPEQRRVLKQKVDRILDNYVSRLLSPAGSLRRQGSKYDISRTHSIQSILSCMILQAKWRIDQPRLSTSPTLSLGHACSQTEPLRSASNFTNSSVKMCSVLSGKKILFAGPESTYYLHDLWLSSLEAHEKRAHFCPGQDYCTFHHICRAPTEGGEEKTDEMVRRKKKMPGTSVLLSSKSSLLQYALSTTLHTSTDTADQAYAQPVIDEKSGVRVPNNYWLRKARKADIVVMNRGPLPAPASTYSSYDALGNWTFTEVLCNKYNRLGGDSCSRFLEYGLVNAALHATLNNFVPRLLHSLQTIAEDPEIRNSLRVWQGSWYLQAYCAQADLPVSMPLLPPISPGSGDASWADPWTFYFNSQVYMHDYVLPKLLPYFNATYLPLTIPIFDGFRGIANPKGNKTFWPTKPKDCMRKPWATFGKDGLEVAFYSMLLKIVSHT